MKERNYNRLAVMQYAKKWAFKRNSKYYNFDNIGGDCTSFVSQCIFEGSKIMNYKKYTGWYYNSSKDRSPSWSGVEYLYNFLTTNRSVGPIGKVTNKSQLEKGDIIQLKFIEKGQFSHSLLVVDKKEEEIYVATHTEDSYYRPLSSYTYEKIRFLHINKVLVW